MPRATKDLTGSTYGGLTVLRRHKSANQRTTFWDCRCKCGRRIVVRSSDLTGRKMKTCGCAMNKSPRQTYVTIDGETKTLREWANTLGLSTGGMMRRIKNGSFTLKLDDAGQIRHYEEYDDYSDLADVPPVTAKYWER